jgi:hypothetical protein
LIGFATPDRYVARAGFRSGHPLTFQPEHPLGIRQAYIEEPCFKRDRSRHLVQRVQGRIAPSAALCFHDDLTNDHYDDGEF